MKITNTPIIQLNRVGKSYRMGEENEMVLKDINISIYSGEYVSIVGPSGSGKSTLMHILGLLDTPSEGKVLLEGKDVSRLSEKQLAKLRNRHIGFVFQQFNLLAKTVSWQNVSLPLIYCGVSRSERYRRSVAALARVGLNDKLTNRPNQLSGGQQQRVAIARALINNPAIIFADEPTGNLDTTSGNVVMNLFDQLNKEGKTIVLVTHERDIAKHARRAINIIDGRVIN